MRNLPRQLFSGILLVALAVTGTMITLDLPVARAASYTTAQQVPTGNHSLPLAPSVAQDHLGRVWLAYANKSIGSLSNPEIFFKTWNGTIWTNGQQVTSDPADDDATPYVASLSNGSMMIIWSSNRTGGNQYQLFYKLYSGTTSQPLPTTKTIRLPTSASGLNDTQPSITQDRNGRIWVTWVRENVTTRPGRGIYLSDVYYKYFNGTAWSTDFPLPQASFVGKKEASPSISQTKDGRVWIVWASNETADGTFDLFYKTVDATLYTLPPNGLASSWFPKVTLCCSATNALDTHPTIVQSRDGTISVFWDRCTPIATCLDNIFYTISSDNGAHWTSPPGIPLPATSTTETQFSPAAGVMSDKRVWVFWVKFGSTGTELWYTKSDQVLNIHDVGISALAASPRFLRSGPQWDNSGIMNINVTVRNYGDYVENTTLIVKLNNTAVVTMPVINLAVNQTRLLQYSWQSALGFWGKYVIIASLQTVPNESTINQGDNNWSSGVTRVSAPGDVDFNGCVNILDAALLAYSYGSSRGPPPSSLWNASADIDHNGVIDILDAAQLAFYFGDCV